MRRLYSTLVDGNTVTYVVAEGLRERGLVGSDLTPEEASRRLRSALGSRTLQVGRVDADLWGQVQARIGDLLGSSDPAERRRAEPFGWIREVDYLSYRAEYLRRARLKRPTLRVVSVAPPLERFARKLVRRGRQLRDGV